MRFSVAGSLRVIGCAVAVYGATTSIVVMGVMSFNTRSAGRDMSSSTQEDSVFLRLAAAGDGYHFVEIAREGYTYHPKARSSLAFFPVFPLTGRAVAAVTSLNVENALLLAANVYLVGGFVLLALYAAKRYGDRVPNVSAYALLSFGMFPTTYFLRMNYSESSFLFFAILSMLAIEQRWPMVVSAGIVGVTTATRAVGVALVPVLCMSIWKQSIGWREFALRSVLLLPLALSGLIGYMIYQYEAFGQPLAFALTQEHWSFRKPVPFSEKVLAILSHEPIFSVYDPSSEAYWQRIQPEPVAWSNLALANPLFLLLGVGLVVAGSWKKWLNMNETVLASFLILIPYVTRGFEMCMLSQGRFIAAVFPLYLVMGHLLSKCPAPCAALLLCFSAVVMAIYVAQFVAGYMLI